MATDFTSQITAIYQAVEYRNPPAAELAVYNSALQSGTLTLAQVQSAVINDPFTTNIVDVVIREYQAAFGRVPDQAGASFWVGQVASNPSLLTNLNTVFASSTEFQGRFGATATTPANSALVTALYTNVYGRAPDAAGLAFWSNSGLTAAQLLQAFSNAAEFITQTTPAVQAFQALEIAGTAPTTGSLFNVAPAGGGSNFVLTTGVDFITATAGNDTIVADNTAGAGKLTLTAADTVNGGTGTDTLKVFSDASAGAIAPITTATLNSVENIFVNNIGANNIDVSGIAGVTGLQLDAPGASLTATLKAQSFTLSNDAAGGHTITLATNAADTSEAITLSKVGATGAADTIDFSNAALTSASILSTGAANFLTLTDTGAKLASLTITGDQKLTLTESIATLKTINASTDTGGVSVDTSGVAVNAGFAFTGGTGADTLVLAAGSIGALTAGTQLDGGAGKDTLTLNDAAFVANDYAHISAVKNFEVLGFGASSAFDASQATNFKEFAVNGAFTDVISNAANGSILDVNGSTTAVTFGAAVGATAATVNLGTATTAGITLGTLTTSGFTSIALNNAGTAGNTITTFANADNSNIVLTGSNDLTITNALAGTATGSKFDASAFTGKLSVVGSTKADIIIGGSGADTIKANGGGDTLTGGGGTDKFILNAAGDVGGAGVITTITDIGSKEQITLSAAHATDNFVATKVDVSAATTLTQALTIAAAGDGGTNSITDWFQFGGNTYIVQDNTTGALAATDEVVKLVGNVDLTLATYATHVLTLA